MPDLILFDTTLRDGEQSPGARLSPEAKGALALGLSLLGVDVIEAGFPAASPGDRRAVEGIARRVGRDGGEGRPQPTPPVVCGLARATVADIDVAWSALRPASRPRIHTFLATSPVHRRHKLQLPRAEVLRRVRESVSHARDLCEDVEFSAEDAVRTEPEFLREVLIVAREAGASTLNVPDTVGVALPHEFEQRIAALRACPELDGAVLSVHCHDDLGLATANTLAGIRGGARQVEVTMNGVGERAGNCALEEVVMALETHGAALGVRTQVDTTRLCQLSREVSEGLGFPVPPNKAVVGANAFAHEAGIHQDGVLKHRSTYEILRAEDVGAGSSRIVMGKHSGRRALQTRLHELGVEVGADEIGGLFERFKQLADREGVLTDQQLRDLVLADASAARSSS